jgi:hypothetical protein
MESLIKQSYINCRVLRNKFVEVIMALLTTDVSGSKIKRVRGPIEISISEE